MVVFLSYSSRDKCFVRRLASDLDKARVELWLDERELRVGQSVGGDLGALQEAIGQSECLIVVLSRSATASTWVAREIELAEKTGIPVLPVLLEDVPVEWAPRFAGLAHADFRRPEEYRRALSRLSASIKGKPATEMFLSAKAAVAKVINDFAPEGDLYGISHQGIATLYSSAVIGGWEYADARDGTSRWWVVEFFDARRSLIEPFCVVDGSIREAPKLHVGRSEEQPSSKIAESATSDRLESASGQDEARGPTGTTSVEDLEQNSLQVIEESEIERHTDFRPLPLNRAYVDSTVAVAAANQAAFAPMGPLREEDDLFVLVALERDKRDNGRLLWKVSFFDPALTESVLTVGVDAVTGSVCHPRRPGELLNLPFIAIRPTEDGGATLTIGGTSRAMRSRVRDGPDTAGPGRSDMRATLDPASPGLRPLSPATAFDLLDATVRADCGREDTRVRHHRDAANAVADWCGHLPIALQLVAALLVQDPAEQLVQMTAALADQHAHLHGNPDGLTPVRAAFNLCYRQLDEGQARLLRLLPLVPGPDVSSEAVAAVFGCDLADTERVLDELAGLHLVEATGTRSRWRLDDLIRVCAEEHGLPQAGPDQRDAAMERLLHHYLVTADAACQHLRPQPGITALNRFTGRSDALSWLDTERSTLFSVVELAAGGHPGICVDLTLTVTGYLSWKRDFQDIIAISQSALSTARGLGRATVEAALLGNLGAALGEVGRPREAIEAIGQAEAIFREAGDSDRAEAALSNLSRALREARQFAEAIDVARRAVAGCRESGNRHGQGDALNTLGMAFRETRRFAEAIDAFQESIVICLELGDQQQEASALTNLSIVMPEVGRPDEAIEAGQRAVSIYRNIGNRRSEGIALTNLGNALREVGRVDEAIGAYDQGLAICLETGDQRQQAIAINSLGTTLLQAGRLDEAIDTHRRALAVCREIGNQYGEAKTLSSLASALDKANRNDEAIDMYRQALAIFIKREDRDDQAVVLNNLGNTFRNAARADDAIESFQGAATIFAEAGNQRDHVRALNNLAIALQGAGRFEDAAAVTRQLIPIFRETGDRRAEAVALDNYGIALRHTGQLDQAIDACRAAADIFAQTGDQRDQAVALNNLGMALQHADRFGEAVEARRIAAAIFIEAGDQTAGAEVLSDMGTVLRGAGRFEDAAAVTRQLIPIFRETGDRRAEAVALDNYGIALRHTGQLDQAIDACRAAADIFAQTGDKTDRRIALANYYRATREAHRRRRRKRPQN
jgi:tetratricopeptide (TPR) repeat protein